MIDQRDYFALANDPRVRPVLDAIAMAEGTTEHGYHTMFGGGRIDDLSDHPRKKLPFTQTDGKRNYSSAAGQYQFLEGTWDDAANQLGLTDFSPANQDAAATFLIDRAGALDDLLNGNVQDAIDKLGTVWASLPNSPYAQPRRTEQEFQSMLDTAYGNSALPRTKASYATTQPQTNTQKEKPMASMLEQTLAKIAPTAQALGDLRQTPDFANSPELLELLSKKGRQDASMLPLAVGALLSGDKQFQQLGASMYQAGQEGRNPIKMGDYGFIDPSNGGFVENPMAAANNANADLSTAANLTGDLTRAEAEYQRKASADALRNKLQLLDASIDINRSNQNTAKFENDLSTQIINWQKELSDLEMERSETLALKGDSEFEWQIGEAGLNLDDVIQDRLNSIDAREQMLRQGIQEAKSRLNNQGGSIPNGSEPALKNTLAAIGQGSPTANTNEPPVNQSVVNAQTPVQTPTPEIMPQSSNPPGMPPGLPQTMRVAGLVEQPSNVPFVPVPKAPMTDNTNSSVETLKADGKTDIDTLIKQAAEDGYPTVDGFKDYLKQKHGKFFQPDIKFSLPNSQLIGFNDNDGTKVFDRKGKKWYSGWVYNPQKRKAEEIYYKAPKGWESTFTPVDEMQEKTKGAAGLLTDMKEAQELIKLIKENREIFSKENRVMSFLTALFGGPGASVQGDFIARNLTPEQQEIRQRIGLKGAELINKFYGKQVTGGESSMAQTIFPRMDQNPDIAIAAFQALINHGTRLEGMYGNKAVANALSRAKWRPEDFDGISERQKKDLIEMMNLEVEDE